ncbi:MlaC/ttg2D family ABC transporter substrate-binding protein [Desulfogranum mediterraneum]|uniref:MlaC/ttg2D family ABC transporter substrate-binding protein n=1 Tax=Desulfogranum mediterraneum TaxID=160661 RepID=UPI000687DE1C|nr:ABC transporter substrate-binding protein [Desulfogranum mediterraneum]
MKIQGWKVVLLGLMMIWGGGGAQAGTVPAPTAQLRPFIQEILTILDEETTTVQGEERIERIMAVARQGFDFREMSRRVLGKQWRRLSPAQQDEFVAMFTELLQYAYVAKMNQYSEQEVTFGKERIRGKRAQVETLLVGGDTTIPVSYIMLLKQGQWMVYDIVVEGVSLVRNYMEQFQGIMRKESFGGLTRRIGEKIAELQQKELAG